MEIFTQILAAVGFAPEKIDEYMDTIVKLALVRFRQDIEKTLSDEEKSLLPSDYLQFDKILNIKEVPDEELRIKLFFIISATILGILSELLAKTQDSVSEEQKKKIETILNNHFKINS